MGLKCGPGDAVYLHYCEGMEKMPRQHSSIYTRLMRPQALASEIGLAMQAEDNSGYSQFMKGGFDNLMTVKLRQGVPPATLCSILSV